MLSKITAHHLQRLAFLYVRQSTLQQVIENRESTARQYALQNRAVAFGWPHEQIVVICQERLRMSTKHRFEMSPENRKNCSLNSA